MSSREPVSTRERFAPLPNPPSAMIGRETDVAALAARLTEGGVRFLTVAGGAGVGKTRLALEVAATASPRRFPDGVAVVDLGGVAPDQAILVLADRLAAPRSNGGDPVADVVAAVGRRGALLVLDNVDPLLGDATLSLLVTRLIAEDPGGPVVLLTCRRRLGLQGEHVHTLTPLAVEPASSAPACRLFARRAEAVVPGFALAPAVAGTVAAVCRRCDGLPLAIELAAARLAHLTLDDLLVHLDRPLDVLTGGPRDRPARHRSMREAIAWTYDRLPPDERALLGAVAVLPGALTLDAAAAVGDRPDPLVGLSALVDAGLLERRSGADGQTRFALLGTTRAFGLEALGEEGETDHVHRALVDHVVASTEAIQPDLRSDDPARALDRLEAEHETIRAALGWAFRTGMAREGLRICTAVYGFWMHRGHLEEAVRWLRRGLAVAVAGDEAALERANAELLLGHSEPDVARSTAAYVRALEIYRSVGNDRNTAGALTSIGVAAGQSGAYGRAAELLREARVLFEAMGAETDLAQVEYHLGRALRSAGRLDDAQQTFETARGRCERLGDSVGVVYALLELGMIARQRGRLTEATVVLEWCARRAEALGLFPALVDAQTALASVALARGEGAAAEGLYQAVVRRFVGVTWPELGPVPALDGFALAVFPRRPELAIRIAAAVATWRRTMNYPRDPMEEQRIVRALRDARQALSTPAYERAWALGLLDGSLSASIDEVAAYETRSATPAAEPLAASAADGASLAALTRQERTVLCHIVGGATNQEVADTLSISPRTVGKHVENILGKLGVGNRTAAAAMAVLGGLCRAETGA